MMYALVKPKFFIPVHGERRMLHKSGDMIVGMGHDRRNIIIGENGRVIELTAKSAKLGATVPSGRVLVDGMGVGDVGTVVLRDRKLLADEGMVVVVMTVSYTHLDVYKRQSQGSRRRRVILQSNTKRGGSRSRLFRMQ